MSVLPSEQVAVYSAVGLMTCASVQRARAEVHLCLNRGARAFVLDFSRTLWALSEAQTEYEMLLLEPAFTWALSGAWVAPELYAATFQEAALCLARRGAARCVFISYAPALSWATSQAQLPAW